jgi:epoxyqueuosine reductase
MTPRISLTTEIITQAESYDGVCAGLTRMADRLARPLLNGRSGGYQSVSHWEDDPATELPAKMQTVLVLGCHHPESDLHLDYWERGDTWGNRRLREIASQLTAWLRERHGLTAQPLPYHVERGGLFLKDAAVLSGIGVIGRSNLLLHPQWGPRIRLRSILLEGDWQPTQSLEGFDPCQGCRIYCRKACPVKAFPQGKYSRAICLEQITYDTENKVPEGGVGEDGKRNPVIKYCRACELSCPVGA